MLIELKVKTELPVVLLLFRSFEWFKQVSDIIHGEQRVSMSNCNICKPPKASASKLLAKHKNQQMVLMGKRPTSCAVVVLDRQAFKVPLRKKLGYLRKNIVTRMHTYSNFDLDANVRISKVRQGLLILCNCE